MTIFPGVVKKGRLFLSCSWKDRVLSANLLFWIWLSGCSAHQFPCDLSCVSGKVQERTGHDIGSPPKNCAVALPPGLSLEKGLTEEEAVVIALWNNAAFQELLTDLGIARGDLIQAGLLPNPEFVYYFPVHLKPFKYLFDMPLEAFWLKPIRVAAAGRELDRVSERLTQAALDLIRDTRQAYADVLLARGRQRVAEEAVRLRGQIAKLAEARLQEGDISVQEATAARIDVLLAQEDNIRIGFDIDLAEERLRNLLAIGVDRGPLHLNAGPPPQVPDLDAEQLTAQAVAERPDALAVEQAVAAAAERLRLSRLNWVRFLGIADATSGRGTGHELSQTFRVTLPIFNWNQGNIARAAAELDKAERQRLTVRNQIILDVHQAHYRFTQARKELEFLDGKVRPEVEAAIRRAERAYREGNTSYVVVLEATRQLIDSHLRQEQLQAELRRAWAELERSVGRHLVSPSPRAGPKELPP